MLLKGFYLFMLIALSFIFILVYGCAAPAGNDTQLKDTTQKIQPAIQSELNNLDADVSAAALKLKSTGLSGDGARQILSGLCTKYSYLVDCSTVDTTGKVITMAPDAYRSYEGSNIETQDIKSPVFSSYLKAVEGMMAVSLMYPVLDEKGQQVGIIDALFKPDTFFAGIAGPALKGTNIELNVIQPDGLVIYDSQGDETGKNFITDPALQSYKDLVALNIKITAEESGTGNYTYINHNTGAQVKKQAFWSSVKLHGTSWRLVDVQEIAK
jgi:hypothetical protein